MCDYLLPPFDVPVTGGSSEWRREPHRGELAAEQWVNKGERIIDRGELAAEQWVNEGERNTEGTRRSRLGIIGSGGTPLFEHIRIDIFHDVG